MKRHKPIFSMHDLRDRLKADLVDFIANGPRVDGTLPPEPEDFKSPPGPSKTPKPTR